MKIYHDFDRALLRDIQRLVKRRYPWLDMRDALIAMRNSDRRSYFVEGHIRGLGHVRQGLNWHTEMVDCVIRWQGRANSAAHAKYQAWSEHLRLMDGND